MAIASGVDPLNRYSDHALARPIPPAIGAARRDVLDAVAELRTIPDTDLTNAWSWKSGSKEEIRYGFYRIGESFELASIEAGGDLREAGHERRAGAHPIATRTTA